MEAAAEMAALVLTVQASRVREQQVVLVALVVPVDR